MFFYIVLQTFMHWRFVCIFSNQFDELKYCKIALENFFLPGSNSNKNENEQKTRATGKSNNNNNKK